MRATVIRQDVLEQIVKRSVALEALCRRQARRLEEHRVLLRTALHELAVERGINPPERYYHRWLHEHRANESLRRLWREEDA